MYVKYIKDKKRTLRHLRKFSAHEPQYVRGTGQFAWKLRMWDLSSPLHLKNLDILKHTSVTVQLNGNEKCAQNIAKRKNVSNFAPKNIL